MSQRDRINKKPSPAGCIIIAVVAILAFIFLPWQVALGVSLNAFWLPMMVHAIIKEMKQIITRSRTQKSTIAASRDGFTEVVVRVKNEDPELKTWLQGEPAAIHWLTITRRVYSESSREFHVSTMYTSYSADKKILVSDGSDDAWVLFHSARLHMRKKRKRLTSAKMKAMLQDRPLNGFPLELLDDTEKMTVEEAWLEAGQPIYVYGDMRKVSVGDRPRDLLRVHEDQIQPADQSSRTLNEDDWQNMENVASESVRSQYRILSSIYNDYSRNDIKPLMLSTKGDRYANGVNIANMVGLSVGIIFLLGFSLLLLNSFFPEYMPPYDFSEILESIG